MKTMFDRKWNPVWTLFSVLILLLILASFEVSFGAEKPLPTPTPSPLGTSKTEGFGNESEVGLIISSGNAPAQSANLLQNNSYGWNDNLLKSQLRYYWAEARSVTNARYWLAGLRYERSLNKELSAYVGELVESDRFADYDPRYNSDVGAKYWLKKEDDFQWAIETGYRYTVERRPLDEKFTRHFLRLYMEANYAFSDSGAAKIWIEYLPDIPAWSSYLLNGEASVSAALNEVFAVKTAYLVKYDNRPASEALSRTDSLLTTSLVAKF